MATLLWIEHDEVKANLATQHLVSAAKKLNQPIVALVVGKNCEKVAKDVALVEGVDKVLHVEADYYYPFRAEPHALLLQFLAVDYDAIFAASTTTGKNILPRLAGLLHMPMLSDVIEITANKEFIHPIYAGNALSRQRFKSGKMLATIRASRFDKASLKAFAAPIEIITAYKDDARTKVISQFMRDSSQPDLQTAKIIISGGRGLGSKEHFQLIETLAKILGAAVGATRAAVDAGFVPNDYQVGQTGKIVAPDIYIAIGVSGAVQHLAGMKDSKVIVAINKDSDAPIFEIASFGLVGDLFSIVPELIKKLEELI